MRRSITNRLLYCIYGVILLLSGCRENIHDYKTTDQGASIFPDYTDIVIPCNIAPLNFRIDETGSKFRVDIYSKTGKTISIAQTSPSIVIPIRKWHTLLHANKGNMLNIDIYVFNSGNWCRYRTIQDTISADKIDKYLAYRLINTGYVLWRNMGIYQRDLENFSQKAVFENASSGYLCVNCHSFCNNDPANMSMHFRKVHVEKIAPGTLILHKGIVRKINTKTDYTMSPCVYTSWHPGGDYIAFSVNKINQVFSSDNHNPIEVSDAASDLVVYNIEKNEITTAPAISSRNRENLPAWSPDGKWLYYISAPEAKGDYPSRIFCKYDLVRISFDITTGKWGRPDTILSSEKTGLSISFPKISPDGNFLLFCMSTHGYFDIFHESSDLYVMDLKTKAYKKTDVLNSTQSESYHSWSSTGRWIIFSSKRMGNLYTRPFIAWFDSGGNFHKPFVLPQKEPSFYNTFLRNYNLPELITGKIGIDALQTRDFIKEQSVPVTFDKTVDIDALSGATRIKADHKSH
jgi:hypothetical protein